MSARKLPPIPATTPSVLGPVPTTRVRDLRDKKDRACYGIWRSDVRDVRLESDMALVKAWHTYWHEWAHIVMDDAGVISKDDEVAERLCDAFATARVREMLDKPTTQVARRGTTSAK